MENKAANCFIMLLINNTNLLILQTFKSCLLFRIYSFIKVKNGAGTPILLIMSV